LFDGVRFDLVRAAGRTAHGQNIAILGFTTKQENNTGSLPAYRGKPLIFERKIPEGVFERPAQGVSLIRRFQFQKRSQLFIRAHNETVSKRASIIQIVRPSESRADTQPKVHPGFLKAFSLV